MSDITQLMKAKAREAHTAFCAKHDHINITLFEAIYYAGVLDGLAQAKAVLLADKAVETELARISA